MRLISFDEILDEIEKEIGKNNPSFKLKVHLLLNRINPSTLKIDSILEPFKTFNHYAFMNTIIRDRSFIKFSPAMGKSVLEAKIKTTSDLEAKKEIMSFCQEIQSLK